MIAPAPIRTRRSHVLLAFALAAYLCVPAEAASPPAARGDSAMVVSASPEATRIGVEVLREGGNAVDAAVAVAFALAVAFPEAGNLGGGGFLLYRDPQAQAHALDFRETAPRALSEAHFRREDGTVDRSLSQVGGLAVGTPGSVAGLFEAHRRWGSLPWPRLVQPAIELAQEGIRVSPRTASTLAAKAESLAADDESRRIFMPAGGPLRPGERLVQRDLAVTLSRIAEQGPAGFYSGSVAAAVVDTVQRYGGVMTTADLEAYAPVSRQPLAGRYRGRRVVTFPPPSGGGVVLLQLLGMLERFDLAGMGAASSRSVHTMVEAERRAFADRGRWLGDPDHVEIPLASLLSADYLDRRARSIRKKKATPSDRIEAGDHTIPEGTSTTHVSITDGRGGAVALTTTLNSNYGAAIVARGTGVLLNNEIDDFSLAPGVPDQYGLVGGTANAVGPKRRPLSSMTPTIVECPEIGPRPCLVLGSPGGSAIITSVAQVLVNVVDHGMPLQQAVDFPRFHHQWLPDRIDHEPWSFAADVSDALIRMGHRLHGQPSLGHVSAIRLHPDGAWRGAADPRRGGLAAGY